jgi:hypothetical protein
MERDSSQTLYTVVLTGVRDKKSQMQVAQTLSSVSGRLPMEAVMQRLNALPWTLTRKASYKRAYRLAKLLESLGAQVRCIPPLPKPVKPLTDETQILPSAELLSHTQVMSATQFIPAPDEEPPSPAPPVSPPTRDRMQRREAAPREPASVEGPAEQPLPEQPAADTAVGFFRKHLWTILVGILVTAFMAGGLVLAWVILARFRG